MPIAREWSGWVPAEHAHGFHEHLLATGVSEAETVDGFVSATILRRDDGDGVRFTLITCWADEAAVHRFVGIHHDSARHYPDDARFGLRPDRTATHHQVLRSQTNTAIRQAYIRAARAAADLLHHPAVAASWDEPSALKRYRVSGLAGHLAGQVTFAGKALDAPEPDLRPIAIQDYYDRVAWMTPDHDSEAHTRIRHGSNLLAEAGAAALAARTDTEASRLPDLLAATPILRRVQLPTWQWALTLDDFLLTRLVEMAVHIDDLATSVGLPTPPLPGNVTGPVLDLLTDLAVRQHGHLAVLRALTRTERAPTTISAF